MSRTIRRKNLKNPYLHYTAEEFTSRREEFEAGDWRGENHYFNYHTGEWVTRKKKWYDWAVASYVTFDHYKASREAKHHADHGYQCGRSSVPRSFRNVLERALRAKHKCQIVQALNNGTEEDILLTPYIRDAAWWYW